MVTSLLSTLMPAETDPVKMAMAATIVGTGLYLGNIALSFYLPEPEFETLPD
jgi:hypothetical protein